MQFLSDEHFAAANAAFIADAELQRSLEGVSVAIMYFVSAGPDGDFEYYIRIARGTVTMGRG